MKKFFINKYRIVTDKYNCFEVQTMFWWFPFWTGAMNSHVCLEEAKEFLNLLKKLDNFKSKVVYKD